MPAPPAHVAAVVERVRVRGFRGLRDVTVELSTGTTVLVGPNNAGKTSFLHALETAVGRRRATEDDLAVSHDGGETSESFTVDVVLAPADGPKFDDPITSRVGTANLQRTAGGEERIAFRMTGTQRRDGDGILLRGQFLAGWPTVPGDDGTPTLDLPPNARSLVTCTVLDANRDLVGDLRARRSWWGRLVSALDFDDATVADLEARLDGVADDAVDNSPILTALQEELASVATTLQDSVASVTLRPLPVQLDELARSVDVQLSVPAGPDLPLRNHGAGSRSLAALTVYHAFVRLRLGADDALRPLPLSAFEEPEAHLHPQAQAAVRDVIDAIPGQGIISTHSPEVVAASDIVELRIFGRSEGEAVVHQIDEPPVGLDAERLHHVLQRQQGPAIFARLVLVGDGVTEAAVLPEFAAEHWRGGAPAVGGDRPRSAVG